MKDLHRCLDEYPPALLEAIAAAWQVPLARGPQRQLVLDLGNAMSQPGAAQGVIGSLSPGALAALDVVLHAGGTAPAHWLAADHGALRRFGPAKLEREQPWLAPENAVEELYFCGLLYRAYGSVGDFMGEVLLVPTPLLQHLMAWRTAEIRASLQAPAPVHTAREGTALAEDLFAALVHVRRGRGRTLDAPLDLGPRRIGEGSLERLALLGRLLHRLGLVEEAHGKLRAGRAARDWLHLADDARAWSIYIAWRDDPTWDERTYLDEPACPPAGEAYSPTLIRRNLLRELGRLPAEAWLALEAALQRLRPYVHLDGSATWDDLGSRLARHLLTQPLRWLGLVDIGYDGDGHPIAVRINALGARILGREALLPEDAPSAPEPALAQVDEEFRVHIPLEGTLYARYQLERFAAWQEQGAHAIYRITGESVWDGQNAGVKVEQILAFLNRISGGQVAPVVVSALQSWGSRFGRVMLRRQVVLEAADEKTMQQITSQADVRSLLGRPISSTMCLVAEEDVDALTLKLKALGIWPHVKR